MYNNVKPTFCMMPMSDNEALSSAACRHIVAELLFLNNAILTSNSCNLDFLKHQSYVFA